MFSATFSAAPGAASVSTGFAATVFHGSVSATRRGCSPVAGPAPSTRGPSLVSRSMAAEYSSVRNRLRMPVVAPVDVVRVVDRARGVDRTSPSPPTGTSPSPRTGTSPPTRAETTRHQSCQEQRAKNSHFPTVDRSHFHIWTQSAHALHPLARLRAFLKQRRGSAPKREGPATACYGNVVVFCTRCRRPQAIGNWGFECQSHYWISNNRVRWAARWSKDEIDAGRAHDQFAKERYFGMADAATDNEPRDEPGRLEGGKAERGFWRKLRNWWK